MATLTISRLTDTVGAEVTGLDAERFSHDDSLPGLVSEALDRHGVLVFPKLGLDEIGQVAFGERLGKVEFAPGPRTAGSGATKVTLDPTKTKLTTLKGAFNWHMDGCTLPEGRFPGAVTILTSVALSDQGGQTEFASTYNAYEALTPEEIERLEGVRVVHTVAATQRLIYPNPTAEQEASWAIGSSREHPLIWKHESGRRSLVLGATAESVVGMDEQAGRALLDDLLSRATGPGKVYQHEWSIGDTVMWDNRGMLHRVLPYPDDSDREMIRTCLLGEEEIR